MFELIKELTELSGPVGQEGPVLDFVEALWRAEGAAVERTRIGNLIARIGGSGPKVLLAAHADELCYLVRSVDQDGFIWLANGQAWQRTYSMRNAFTIGQRVHILARQKEVPGVIATTTGHLATLFLPEPKELSWDDFWVDTGLSRNELLEAGVTPGTRVVWDAETTLFGRHVVGKALDDRGLLAVLTEMVRRIDVNDLACELSLACTVQEEIGLIGAAGLAANEGFDAAIALDVGLAGDLPVLNDRVMPLALGAGPMLVHKDSLVHYHYDLTRRLESVALQHEIPIQHAVFGSFGSDGAAFMKADIPAALVGFPTRYTHTPFETAHLDDIEALVEWIAAFVRTDHA